MSRSLRLAAALDGAGWHPAAWREPDAQPDALFTAGYWAGLAAEAERGLLDFVTIEDSLGPQTDRTDRVQGRLDAVLIASRIAPLTRNIGFLPTVIATHTEPFHISKAIATLDYVSQGRGGVRPRISVAQSEADHFGRREVRPEELLDEVADYVEVLRRLWDSWEDDAEIRDVATGRFVDRGKLHYIDFEGRFFKVKGPSITPRPPQGQPPVAVLAHADPVYRLAERSADVVFVTERDAAVKGPLVFTDLVVFLDESERAAEDRKARLDEVAGEDYTSDAEIFVGTPAQLADRLLAQDVFGYRLRPAAIPHDLTAITRGLVPELQRRGVFRREYEANTLRGLLGLDRPANRYAA
ncbi:LLM class flavin-dependent oxidoreductase [Amycolatopsis pithecellobii]|uniref:LLM class flavin-dependent oxidoreductase n=1 Tax=Amycolatopsis pithecellobii TaxID=664692 RepID=A0A6N7YIU0_9PSEU|nr:LLM class flavin-dependent oxidoreductase [Amycolatopsis pithecellobii]MTD52835.1 LLM class flavin-dependent oxidoreductase [Amycolatopsis pithecellobii]